MKQGINHLIEMELLEKRGRHEHRPLNPEELAHYRTHQEALERLPNVVPSVKAYYRNRYTQLEASYGPR